MKTSIDHITMAGVRVPLAGPIEIADGESLRLRIETPKGSVRVYEATAPFFVFHEIAGPDGGPADGG